MERILVECNWWVHPFSLSVVPSGILQQKVEESIHAGPTVCCSIMKSTHGSKLSQGNKSNWVNGKLDMPTIRDLSQHLLNNWDKKSLPLSSNLARHPRV
jgi:hypothetical protein